MTKITSVAVMAALASFLFSFAASPALAQPNTSRLMEMNGSELAEVNISLVENEMALDQAIDLETIAANTVLQCQEHNANYNTEGIRACTEYYKASINNNIEFLDDTKDIRHRIALLL